MDEYSIIVVVSVIASVVLAPFGEYLYDLLRVRGAFPDKPTLKVLLPLAMACIPLVLLVALPQIVSQGTISLAQIPSSPIPLWLVLILLLATYVSARSVNVFLRKRPNDSILFHDAKLVTARNPLSFGTIASEVLDRKTADGGISLWAYLHPFEQGIRQLENNRYLIGHGTNGGHVQDFGDGKRYPNVFALRYRPTRYDSAGDPLWEVCISDQLGREWTLRYPDSQRFEPGWHHFVLRWDHGRQILEFLVDGETIVKGNNYLTHWPEQRDQAIWIGTWPNKAPIHYVETQLWRVQAISAWPTDKWIKNELQRRKPDSPVR